MVIGRLDINTINGSGDWGYEKYSRRICWDKKR